MAPLDTGSVSHTLRLLDHLGERVGPAPEQFDRLGVYLRAIREHRGWTLAELAAATRIRRVYLGAIEDGDMSALPSRPFALGYVRAYARALGIDGELAVARFKTEHPDLTEPLRAPVGVKHEDHESRRPLILIAAAAVVCAVVAWNIVQRTVFHAEDPSGPPSVAGRDADIPAPPLANGAMRVGAPTAPPADQTTPAPYVPPGLENTAAAPSAVAVVEAPKLDVLPLGARFQPKGEVYGVTEATPAVVFQARKPALLIVRRADKAPYIARQMQVGQAVRAPIGHGLTVEVLDGEAFNAFVNDQNVGLLAAKPTSLDSFAAAATKAQTPAGPVQ
ncbi:MAG: helix-turn-helix domain-containing protein [Pseudomonadota bacterium]|jgi:cytoskeleton protein RodZ